MLTGSASDYNMPRINRKNEKSKLSLKRENGDLNRSLKEKVWKRQTAITDLFTFYVFGAKCKQPNLQHLNSKLQMKQADENLCALSAAALHPQDQFQWQRNDSSEKPINRATSALTEVTGTSKLGQTWLDYLLKMDIRIQWYFRALCRVENLT